MTNEDWESESESETEDRKPPGNHKDGPPWIAGGVLVMMGLLLLVSNITGTPFNNWWALFILIPALGSLYAALKNYSEVGAMTESVRKPLTGGMILLTVSVIFLFDLDWSTMWPFLLVIAGGMMLLTAIRSR